MNKIFDTITFMRFPIILLIIILHAYTVTMGFIDGIGSELYNICTYYPSLILGNMGVPVFFTISGFLFFYRFENNILYSYKKKIKSRIKTLFIPYLLWNMFMLLFLFLLQNMSWTSAYFSGNNESVLNYSLKDFICSFWNTGNGFPILSTLWYIRNLMILCLCSPLLYFFCTKLNILYLSLLGVFWFFSSTYAFTFTSIFFFSLGAYLMIHHVDIICAVKKYKNAIVVSFTIFSLLVVYMHIFWGDIFVAYIQKVLFLLSPIFFFTISLLFVEKKKKIPLNLTKSVFFIYAIHFPIIAGISRILLKILNDGVYKYLTGYFLSILLTISISLLIYKVIQKLSPKFLIVITGNRA